MKKKCNLCGEEYPATPEIWDKYLEVENNDNI